MPSESNNKRVNRPAAGGLTLVELLVVVVILVILIGVVLPLAQPALKGREIREAARQVNTVFAAARTRAAASGRSVGVVLNPDATGQRCYELAFAKVPPPYSGDDQTWRAGLDPSFDAGDADGDGSTYMLLNANSNLPFYALNGPDSNDDYVAKLAFVSVNQANSTPVVTAPAILQKLMESNQTPGTDLYLPFELRLDYRGRLIKGLYINLAGNDNFDGFYVALPQPFGPPATALGTVSNFVPTAPIVSTSIGLPFQIYRGPKRSAATPLELPIGSYIDLSVSGVPGAANFLSGAAGAPIAIMFNPDGTLDRIFAAGTVSELHNPVFLLLGRNKESGGENLKTKAGSLWAVVDRQTGAVRTGDNLVPVLPGQTSAELESELDNFNNLPFIEQSELVSRAWASALTGPTVGGR